MDLRGAIAGRQTNSYGNVASRPAILGLAKVLFMGLCQLSYVAAAPVKDMFGLAKEELPKDPADASLWLYLAIAMVLVLLGGVFAGLTIALMGQDSIHLQVIATSSEGKEKRNAQRVLDLMQKGKHWVLVTLLLSNVIVNETLPIILDRSLGGGWPAVAGSTALIVIFGEVIPQSICARYGLAIGSFMAPYVTFLMWVMGPLAWPTARLLDWALGEDHGSTYKKAGLKTLVTLHRTLGADPTSRLNQDEVTIISAVLDLKEKAVGDIMTPMEDVFTMSADTVLDEATMDIILSAGYSRIPIYEPGNEKNFVGMLLVKILITYDPEDGKKVSEFALATLPETRPETSCLDIVNFFQEGKSHMVLVSDDPGENFGAIGVVTLEDVIEELIGEEIIDESDVYIDVHKAIRRIHPAPKARIPKGHDTETSPEPRLIDIEDGNTPELHKRLTISRNDRSNSPSAAALATSPKTTFLRRSSTGEVGKNIAVRGNMNDMREHLKHLGPSNLASRPKTTRYNTVKIKAAAANGRPIDAAIAPGSVIAEEPYHDDPLFYEDRAPQGGEGEGLLRSAGKDAKDGVQALQQGYGSFDGARDSARDSARSPTPSLKSKGTQINARPISAESKGDAPPLARQSTTSQSDHSSDTVGTMHSATKGAPRKKRGAARSGSITENIIDSGGVRKVVLETNNSSSNEEESNRGSSSKGPSPKASSSAVDGGDDEEEGQKPEEGKRKRRRPRKKNKKGPEDGASEGGPSAS